MARPYIGLSVVHSVLHGCRGVPWRARNIIKCPTLHRYCAANMIKPKSHVHIAPQKSQKIPENHRNFTLILCIKKNLAHKNPSGAPWHAPTTV